MRMVDDDGPEALLGRRFRTEFEVVALAGDDAVLLMPETAEAVAIEAAQLAQMVSAGFFREVKVRES